MVEKSLYTVAKTTEKTIKNAEKSTSLQQQNDEEIMPKQALQETENIAKTTVKVASLGKNLATKSWGSSEWGSTNKSIKEDITW